MQIVTLALVLLLTALGSTGCATIIDGSTQTITVNSNVQGAEVRLNGQVLGSTPLVVEIERGQQGALEVLKPGYMPFRTAMNSKLNMVFLINLFSGGTFGMSTDYSTGAMYEYQPGTYFASLRPSVGVNDLEEWQKREMVRAYVLMNNEALVTELAEGKGEHVDALANVFGGDKAQLVAQWRADYVMANTANDFAAATVAGL